MQPVKARVALGLCFLAQGDGVKANEALLPLRPFASRRFPRLFKAMGWDSLERSKEKISEHCIRSMNVNELKQILKTTKRNDLKGWVYLCLGDEMYHKNQYRKSRQSHQELTRLWDQAKESHPPLLLDVLKRCFLASLYPEAPEPAEAIFIKFLKAIQKFRPQDLKELIDFVVYDLPQNAFIWMRESALKSGNKWILNPSPNGLKFLWLFLMYHENLYNVVVCLAVKNRAPNEYSGDTWENWLYLFAELDYDYASHELYLQIKYDIANIHKEAAYARQFLVQRLQLNPSLKREILPKFLRSVLAERKANFSAPDRKLIKEQIETLLQLFPSDYDLLYFFVLFSDNGIPWQQQADRLSIHFSDLLRIAFHLQLALEEKLKLSHCKKMLPEDKHFDLDFEANWRLIYLMNHPHLKITKKKLEQLINKLMDSDEKKHRAFSQMYAHYGETLSLSILTQWKRACRTWHPCYHLSLYHLNHGNEEAFLRELATAEMAMDGNIPEYASVNKTLTHFFEHDEYDRGDDDLDFDEFDFDEFDYQNMMKALKKLMRK